MRKIEQRIFECTEIAASNACSQILTTTRVTGLEEDAFLGKWVASNDDAKARIHDAASGSVAQYY